MISNYRTVTITANAEENIVPKIHEALLADGISVSPDFDLDFVGFEAEAGTTFKINHNPLKVPSSGIFFSPYRTREEHMLIRSIVFDQAINAMNFWIIF